MTEPDGWFEATEVARRYLAAYGVIPEDVREWLPGGILPEELPRPDQLGGWASGAALDVPDPTVGPGYGGYDEEDEEE